MQLEKTEIHSVEHIILQSDIPYEDVKIELIDHLATEIEFRISQNPDLSFADALRLASKNLKATIIEIRIGIKEHLIAKMIRKSLFSFQWYAIALILFFSTITYNLFVYLGPYAPLGKSIFGLAIIATVLGQLRMARIDTDLNYAYQVIKRYSWVPLFLSAGICYAVSFFFLSVIQRTHFGIFMDRMLLIPVAISFGFFLKVIIDTVVFNASAINDMIKLDRAFKAGDQLEKQLT